MNETRKELKLNFTDPVWDTYPITQTVNPDLGHYYDNDMFYELQKFFKKVDL